MEEMKARGFKIFKQEESPNDGNCRELLHQLIINFSSKFENPIIERLPEAVTSDCRQNVKVMHSLMRNLEDRLEMKGLDRFADDVQSIRQFIEYTVSFLCRTVDKLAQSNAALLKNKMRGGNSRSQCVVCGHRLAEVRIAAIRQRLEIQHEPEVLPEWQNCRFSNKFKPINTEDIRQLYRLSEPIDFDQQQNSSEFYDAILTDIIMKKDNINQINNDRTIKILEDFLRQLFGIHANGSVEMEASDMQFLTQFKIGRDIVNQLYDQFSTNVRGIAKKEMMPAVHRLAKQFQQWQKQRKNGRMVSQLTQTEHKEEEKQVTRLQHKQRSQSSVMKQPIFMDAYRGGTSPRNKLSTFRQSSRGNDRFSKISPSKSKKVSLRNEGISVGNDRQMSDGSVQVGVQTNSVETQTPATQITVQPKSSADLFISTLSALHRKANTTTQQKLPTSDAILKVMSSSDSLKFQTVTQNLSHPSQPPQVRISNIQSIDEMAQEKKTTILPTVKKLQKISQKKKEIQNKTIDIIKADKQNKAPTIIKKNQQFKLKEQVRKSINARVSKKEPPRPIENEATEAARVVDLQQLKLDDYSGDKQQLAKIKKMLGGRKETDLQRSQATNKVQSQDSQQVAKIQQFLEKPLENSQQLNEQPSITEATLCNQNKETSIAFIPNSSPTTRRNHSQLQTDDHNVLTQKLQKRLQSLIQKLSNSNISTTFLRRLFRTVEYAIGNQNWLKAQDMISILDQFRPRITTLETKSFNIPLPDVSVCQQTQSHSRMSQHSRNDGHFQQDRTSIIKEGGPANHPSNFSMMLKQFRRKGKEKLKTEHIIDQSVDTIKLPRILTKSHIANKESEITEPQRRIQRSVISNDTVKIPGTNLYVKRNTKARPYGQHVFNLEDLNIYGGIVEAYNFQTICTKNSLKKHQAMRQPEEIGWLSIHMTDVYGQLEQLRIAQPPKYHQIKSFLRYPYQTVCNDFKVIDTTQQLSQRHFEEMYGMLVKRHLACKSDGLCRHIRGFLKRLGLQIQ